MNQQAIHPAPHAHLRWRARAIGITIAMSAAIAACVAGTEDEEDLDEQDSDAEFRDGCGGAEEYIDENGEEVICVYTEEPGDGGGGDPCSDYPWLCYPGGDDGGDGGGDGGGEAGGGEAGGGGDGGGDGDGGCYTKTFAPVRSGSATSQQTARINAIEASRAKGREDCRHDSYYVGWVGAYCDTGVPDNDPWSNANSWVEGCTLAGIQWTCTAHSTVFCSDYTYHGW